jgi:stage II sporulation protein D
LAQFSKSQSLNISKIIFLIIILFFSSCSSLHRFSNEATHKKIDFKKNIRVLLTETKSLTLRFEKGTEIRINGELITIIKDQSKNVSFNLKGNNITFTIQKKNYSFKEIYIYPKNSHYLLFQEKKYRGFFKLSSIGSVLLLVNFVNLEDYIKGVMLKEMPLGNGQENFEALKAFSILVRTYALKKMNSTNTHFDSFPDTRDQVYGGMDAENITVNEIVDKTKGMFLSNNLSIATVFYHSTCGGFTENVESVFDSDTIPYLISLEDGNPPNCMISPRFNWEEKLSKQFIVKRLFESKLISFNSLSIYSVKIISRFKSGRVNQLQIKLKENKIEKEINLYSNNIRYVLRNTQGKILPSSNFVVEESGNYIIFKGIGFGHGVGMCQWGAIRLSQQGKSYIEILNHYFPKTQIKYFYD